MKYIATIKNGLVLIAIVLINSVGFAGHTSAMSTMSHEMNGINHQSGDATSCATLCRTAVLNKESEKLNQTENEDDDDKVVLPLPQQVQAWEINSDLVKRRLYASEVKPPPKVPFYIMFQVFRT